MCAYDCLKKIRDLEVVKVYPRRELSLVLQNGKCFQATISYHWSNQESAKGKIERGQSNPDKNLGVVKRRVLVCGEMLI